MSKITNDGSKPGLAQDVPIIRQQWVLKG